LNCGEAGTFAIWTLLLSPLHPQLQGGLGAARESLLVIMVGNVNLWLLPTTLEKGKILFVNPAMIPTKSFCDSGASGFFTPDHGI
jgi:hypothetical protein